MTTAQRLSQVFGIVFLIVGLAGFVVTGGSMEANHETAPRLLGMFPVNALHNVVHLLFGVWGLLAFPIQREIVAPSSAGSCRPRKLQELS